MPNNDLKKIKESAIIESNSVTGSKGIASQVKSYIASNGILPKRVAILSNFNLQGMAGCLTAQAIRYDIFLEVYSGQYGQWQQESFGSGLYDFAPDMIYIVLDPFGMDHDLFSFYHSMSYDELNEAIEGYMDELDNAINAIKSRTKSKIVISNIIDYWPKILGIVDMRIKNSLHRLLLEANLKMEKKYCNDSQTMIFDFDGWLGHIGKDKNLYDKFFFLADMRLSPESFPALAEELIAYLVPLATKAKKCIVLDLDNTLWGGILGEDGMDGVKLSPTGDGQSFYLFQKLLLGFHRRGILLAINSKNNEDETMHFLRVHPFMMLRPEHFAAIRINWQDKATNMTELAEELNIGLDSMVFIDDDLANRSLIQAVLPQVDILPLPSDPALYFKCLLSYKGLNYLEFTEEDKQRGQMYLSERERRTAQKNLPDLNLFLRSLDLRIKVESLTEDHIARASQLTQKTNQFNLTTHRCQAEDINAMIEAGAKAWMLRVVDNFGDYGYTGLAIVNENDTEWVIDSFLLSCRILGKRVEEQFLGFILEELQRINPKKIIGKYIPTSKNLLAKDFYKSMGFEKISSSGLEDTWQLDLHSYIYNKIDFISLS